jgi:DNA-directed RNA polymerase subunit RPC12/RpoP
MKYTCPECQKTFKETPSLEDFTAKCPHCGAEVIIAADPTMVYQAKIEEMKKEEAARKEADQKAKDAAEQIALRKQEERNAKAVALVERSLKRICPHCGIEGSWSVRSQPGVESFIVRCNEYRCGKSFTILNSSDDMMTPLTDILKELEVIRFRFGILLVCLFVIPFIVGVIFAIIHAN